MHHQARPSNAREPVLQPPAFKLSPKRAKERAVCSARWRDLLDHVLPFEVTKLATGEIGEEFLRGQDAREFYEQFIEALVAQVRDPSPTGALVRSDGSGELLWR